MSEHRASSGSLGLLLPYLRGHRARLALVFCLVVAAVLIELAQPYLVKEAIDRHVAVADPRPGALLWMAAGYLACSLLAFGLTWLLEVSLQRVGQDVVRAIRTDLFAHVQGLSLRYFDRRGGGRIITNVVNDTEALNGLFAQFLSNTLRGLLSVLLIVFFMLSLDVTLALRCFVIVPLIAVVSIVFRRLLHRVNSEIRSRLSAAIAFLAENLSGIALVQVFHQEAKQERRFDERNRALLAATVLENRLSLLFFNITELLGDLGIAALLWLGGGAVIRGTVTFGVLYAFVGYIRRFFQPINTITQQLNVLQGAIIATERIERTFREQPDIAERPLAAVPTVRGEVKFEGVSLAYAPGHLVLKDIDLAIRPGGTVGIVGASGAGKSSLMNLLARFHEVSGGAVLIDGMDVREWPLAALRRTVGVVQQDVALFSGSIVDNVRFFREDVSEERVREACRLVGAEPFILRRPQGYATMLSARGSTLSAGERQLLSFARVLVFDPQILILDEATASLDSDTEAILQAAIERVSRGRTLLVIAHRLSTVQRLETVVVLEQGRIVERGRPADLLLRRGRYWELHSSALLLDGVG